MKKKLFSIVVLMTALVCVCVCAKRGNNNYSGASEEGMPLFYVNSEKLPVVNTLSILTYSKQKAAEELNTPEAVLGGRVAITEEMRLAENAKINAVR